MSKRREWPDLVPVMVRMPPGRVLCPTEEFAEHLQTDDGSPLVAVNRRDWQSVIGDAPFAAGLGGATPAARGVMIRGQ